jgi:hypothetical protein
LDTPLPYPVKDEEGKAKFDKAKSVLEVVLPTQPPPPPPTLQKEAATLDAESPSLQIGDEEDTTNSTPIMSSDPHSIEQQQQQQQQQQQRQCEERQVLSSSVGGPGDSDVEGGYVMVSSPHAIKDRSSAAVKSYDSSPEGRGEPSPSDAVKEMTGSVHSTAGLSENQLRWQELHNSHQEAAQGREGGGGETPAGGENGSCIEGSAALGRAFEATPSFQGPREGFVFRLGDQGLGYYADSPQHSTSPGGAAVKNGPAAQKALAALAAAGVAGPAGICLHMNAQDRVGRVLPQRVSLRYLALHVLERSVEKN